MNSLRFTVRIMLRNRTTLRPRQSLKGTSSSVYALVKREEGRKMHSRSSFVILLLPYPPCHNTIILFGDLANIVQYLGSGIYKALTLRLTLH